MYEFGIIGYGVYFGFLELICKDLRDPNEKVTLEWRYICKKLSTNRKKVEKILHFIEKSPLNNKECPRFEIEYHDTYINIRCLKLIEIADNDTKYNKPKTSKSLQSHFKVTSNQDIDTDKDKEADTEKEKEVSAKAEPVKSTAPSRPDHLVWEFFKSKYKAVFNKEPTSKGTVFVLINNRLKNYSIEDWKEKINLAFGYYEKKIFPFSDGKGVTIPDIENHWDRLVEIIPKKNSTLSSVGQKSIENMNRWLKKGEQNETEQEEIIDVDGHVL